MKTSILRVILATVISCSILLQSLTVEGATHKYRVRAKCAKTYGTKFVGTGAHKGEVYKIADPPQCKKGDIVILVLHDNGTPDDNSDDYIIKIKEKHA